MVRGVNDVIYAPRYDSEVYPAAGTTILSFFTAAQNNGVTSAPGASGVKTLSDTNMELGGQLGKGNEFYCTGIEFLFFPGVQVGRGSVALADVGLFADDVYTVLKSGIVTLTIGTDRTYIQDGPLNIFPPCTRLAVAAAVGVTNDSDSTAASVVEEVVYAAASGEPYAITPVYIESSQTFKVTVQWPVAVAVPSTVAARLQCRLRGYLIRNAQ